MDPMGWLVFSALFMTVVVPPVYRAYKKNRCPRCRARALRYTYAKKDGGPDARYSHNPRYCQACAWSSDGPDELPLQLPPARVGEGAPFALSVAVDVPSRDQEVREVEAALVRMDSRESPSDRRSIYVRTRQQLTGGYARRRLDEGAAELEVEKALASAARSGEVEREGENLERRMLRYELEPGAVEAALAGFRRRAAVLPRGRSSHAGVK